MNEFEIEILNEHQTNNRFHPKTCMGTYCKRSDREDEGILIATKDYWICPCKKYKQNYMDNDVKTVQQLIRIIEKSGKDLIKDENTISEKERQSIKMDKRDD